MTTATANLAPQPLLPALARFGIAVAVGALLTVCWIGAESQSHRAVDLSSAALSPVVHVTLAPVEIVAFASR
jgi:hypothetical protein